MSKSLDKPPNTTTVSLSSLPPAQLKSLKESVDMEVQALTNHVVELRQATRRFEESKKALTNLGFQANGSEILVPLTQSVFVTGKLVKAENVLIDIGTGYHAEKSISDATKHFEERIQLLGDTCGKGLRVIAEKKRISEAISQQFQEKMQITKTAQ